jgi:protein TonB
MKKVQVTRLRPESRDRLITTLFLAVLFHGMIILGVSFSAEDRVLTRANTLEVTLVSNPDNERPEHAEYLAQADQRGSGNVKEQVRPESAKSTLDSTPNPGLDEGWAVDTEIDAIDGGESPDTLDHPDPEPRSDPLLSASESSARAATGDTTPRDTHQPLELARLLTEGSDQAEPISDENRVPLARSDEPRETFISVNTRESRYARYLEGWRRSVERLGNEHYPEEARGLPETAALSLEVAVNADGTLREIVPQSSSGRPALDRAAAHIVRLAAPFEPFPESIREDTDVLRFVYRWEFGSDRTLRSGVHVSDN